MAEEETRKVKILWEVEDNTAAGLDSVKRRQQQANDQLTRDAKGRFLPGAGGAGASGGSGAGAAGDAAKASAGAFKAGDQAASKFFQTLASGVPSAASVAKSLGEMGLAALGLGAIGGAVGTAVQAIDQLATESLQAQKVSAGLQISITGARAAFGGYVDDVTLARLANKAFTLGVVQDGKDLATLAGGVKVIADNLGEDYAALFDNAVTAIGRGSALILDNLGIILNQAKAQDIYAASLKDTETGLARTADSLDAYEKSIAFGKAATILIGRAGEDAGVKVEGMAAKMAQAKIQVENLRQGVLGFDESIGITRDAMRNLSDAQLALIVDSKYHGQSVVELNGVLGEWGSSLDDIKHLADSLGLSLEELTAKEETRRAAEGAKVERKRFEENKKARLAGWVLEAEAIEHDIELRRLVGAEENELIDLQVEQLTLRLNAAEAAGDLVETLKYQREIEKAQLVGAADKPKSGGGSGPTEADRVRAAGEARLQLLGDELERSEALAELNDPAAQESIALSEKAREVKLAELELERQVLAVTRAKNSVERQGIENRAAQIDREAEIISIEARIEARRHENELIGQAVDMARVRLEVEAHGASRVIDLESRRMGQATERARMDLAEASRISGLTGRRDDLLEVEAAGLRVHELTVAQLGQEALAAAKLLDIREAEIRGRNPTEEIDRIRQRDELEQVAHDRKLARADAEMAVLRAADAEQTRLFTAQQARLQQQSATINTAIGTFENIQGSFQSVISDVTSKARAEQDADLEAWKANLEARTQSQSAALDRQIEGAKNNAGLRRDLERKKAALEKSTQKKIEQAESAHNEKRKRAEMRFQGIMLLVQAAVQTAKAAAAYPVVPSMIAHGIAAGINAGYGIALLAGKVPGAGGGSVGAGGGGASGTAPSASERGSAEVNRVPGSIGGQAAERQGNRGRTVGGQSGNVTFAGNVTINALGSIDEDAATKIGMAVNQGKYIREGAAIK